MLGDVAKKEMPHFYWRGEGDAPKIVQSGGVKIGRLLQNGSYFKIITKELKRLYNCCSRIFIKATFLFKKTQNVNQK